MAVRGDIVDYTFATSVDTPNPDGTITAKIGFNTLPAVVLAIYADNTVDLVGFGEEWQFPGNNRIMYGVSPGPAAPDATKGKRVDPTAVPGQRGTWSARR